MRLKLVILIILVIASLSGLIPVQALILDSPSPDSKEKETETVLSRDTGRQPDENTSPMIDSKDYLLLNGLNAFQSGKYSESLQIFAKVIAVDPNDTMAWYYHGMSQYYLNQSDEAMESFSRVLDLDPDYYMAWYGKSLVYHRQGDIWSQSDAIRKAKEIEKNITGKEKPGTENDTGPSNRSVPLSAGIVCLAVIAGTFGIVIRKQGLYCTERCDDQISGDTGRMR
jgi:hypothetical protein